MKVKLSDVAGFSKGEQVNGDELSDEYQFPFINGGINRSGMWKHWNVEGNTVTISEGGNSCGFVNFVTEPFWCGAHCYYLFDVKGCPKYLYYALKSQESRLMASRSGCCMPNLKKKTLGDFLLCYDADVNIQQKVIKDLDACSSVCALTEEELLKLDQLVKSRFVEMFGDLRVNTKNWPKGRVKDLAEYWNGLTYKPTDVTDNGIVVLRSSNIQSGMLDMSDLVRVSVDAKAKNVVAPNDILMCSRNGSAALVGKTAIIPAGVEKMYFGAFMMIIRGRHPEFLNAFFRSSAFRTQLSCAKTSTVNQITCSMMDGVVLPLPPERLMTEFAAFVAEVDKSKFAVRKRLDKARLLYRAKLQEYFG